MKLTFAIRLMVSLILAQAAAPAIARADGNFHRCGILEEQVRSEIQQQVDAQFHPLKYQVRNEAAMKAVVKAGEQDEAVGAALRAMRGSPKLDNDTRLKYSDLITTFQHNKKLSMPKALLSCPAGYEPDESKLSTSLWKPDTVPTDRSAQGLTDQSDLPKACHAANSSVLPEESTSISTDFGDSWGLGAINHDPKLIAITDVDRPVTVKFRGKSLVLSNLAVMSYMHLKDGAFEHADEYVFLHGKEATIDGRKIELEAYIDNELLPPACKDFHYGPVADGGGSGNGGKNSPLINDQTAIPKSPSEGREEIAINEYATVRSKSATVRRAD